MLFVVGVADNLRFSDFQNPGELAILTQNELVIVDLDSVGFPSIEPAHPMDIHDSPVTCLKYVPDPSTDLTPGLYQTTLSKAQNEKMSRKVGVVYVTSAV